LKGKWRSRAIAFQTMEIAPHFMPQELQDTGGITARHGGCHAGEKPRPVGRPSRLS
jgi:hypothetical protein